MNKLILIISVVLLSACASLPVLESNEKKLIAAEVVFKRVLLLADKKADGLTVSEKIKAKRALVDADLIVKKTRLKLSTEDQTSIIDNLSDKNDELYLSVIDKLR